MKNLMKFLPWIIVAVLGWYVVFGEHTGPVQPPRIITQYDTVTQIDTQWVTKLKHDTIYKTNIVERIITEKPETLKVFIPVSGLLAVSVPKKVGDSTLVFGFHIRYDTTSWIRDKWEYQFWTPGPLKSLTLNNGVPSIDFYDPPKSCALKCRLGWGAAMTIGVEIGRIVLGRP